MAFSRIALCTLLIPSAFRAAPARAGSAPPARARHASLGPLSASAARHASLAARHLSPVTRRSASARRCAARSTLFGLTNEDVHAAFSVATFAPQPFWLLMIGAPRWSGTRFVMRPLLPVAAFALVHLFIVVASAGQEGGTAEIAEFAKVFDASAEGDPQGAMVGMMRAPNFVAEEWSHVLTWDLFVGRWIWADGLARGVPIRASVLLTNLIGPPGLLLHLATCLVTGKGLPPPPPLAAAPSLAAPSSAAAAAPPPATVGARRARADERIRSALDGQRFDAAGLEALGAALADGAVWEDLSGGSAPTVGKAAVLRFLAEREAACPPGCFLRVERVADGADSSGFTWTRVGADGAEGLRGNAYVELEPSSGKIAFVQEVAEPLFKPGGATAALLRAIAKPDGTEAPPPAYTRRTPTLASELADYLWNEVRGSDLDESVRLFAEDIVYEDFNFETPFVGRAQAEAFLREFDIPGISFVPERISQGADAVAFTWRVAIAGVEGRQIRGISFYALDAQSRKLAFVRDVPEPAIRPAPLGAIAAALRPGLRKL